MNAVKTRNVIDLQASVCNYNNCSFDAQTQLNGEFICAIK